MKRTIRVLGLTGGIGAGKSTVAELLRREGVPVLDMDRIGREILDTAEGVRLLEGLFGNRVIEEGKVNRRRVREIVFDDESARRRLESALHPLIRRRFEDDADRLAASGKRLVISEAALLVETGRHRELDGLVVVLAKESTRLDRVMRRDSIPETLARQISAAQIGDQARREAATWIVENDGSLEHLATRVKALVGDWRARGWID